jgi:hypothetical protein
VRSTELFKQAAENAEGWHVIGQKLNKELLHRHVTFKAAQKTELYKTNAVQMQQNDRRHRESEHVLFSDELCINKNIVLSYH